MVPFLILRLSQNAICRVKNPLGMLMYVYVHCAASRIFALQLILFSFFSSTLYAWNSLGHELVAEMALAQLNPAIITRLEQQNAALKMGYQPKRLTQAAVWLDWFRCQESSCKDFRYYHYIDYPYAPDGTPALPPRSVNALKAVDHALQVLNNSAYSAEEKGLQLRILMHVVADLHQPMHTVSLYRVDFPQGDAGGNRFILGPNRVANNLHAYWDRGGGLLVKHARRKPRALKQQARRILKHYPCDMNHVDLNPAVWAAESYQLATQKAYRLEPHDKPSRQYQLEARKMSEQRLALAGCRLAALLST